MKSWSRTMALAVVLCSLCFLTAWGRTHVPSQGMWRSTETGKACGADCQQQLVESLRRLTGWQGLHFNENGKLVVTNPEQFMQGSSEARQLFQRVWKSPDVYWIEDHSHSEFVNFGQLSEGLVYEDLRNGRKCNVWHLRMDLDDFDELQASRLLRATFDAGFTFMHELLHGLGHKDSHSFEEVGECEEIINRIRQELGLPMRAQYFAETFSPGRFFISAKLLFIQTTSEGKERKNWIYFRPGRQTLTENGDATAASAVTARSGIRQR